jgi:hypothetical protein
VNRLLLEDKTEDDDVKKNKQKGIFQFNGTLEPERCLFLADIIEGISKYPTGLLQIKIYIGQG